jgi:uncharacterized peroxidase-related enzyme
MEQSPITGLTMVDEQSATGNIATLYDNIRRGMEIPFVPNIFKAQSPSGRIAEGVWEAFSKFVGQTTLPASLASMIGFSVAAANNCTYCNSLHKVSCRTIGIDDDTLTALSSDLGALTPERIQEIISFAVKVGSDPQSLEKADYDRVRDQGVSDDEIMEIITVAAWATFSDRLADALKVDLDDAFKDALRT